MTIQNSYIHPQDNLKPRRTIYLSDCLKVLPKFSTESIDLVVTSPPYNANQEYEEQLSDKEYESFIVKVFKELHRVLKKDGRICWVVMPTVSRKDRELPFDLSYCSKKSALKANLKLWEEIVWDQGSTEANTAWGSWRSASSPFIRHKTERILLFVKETRKRNNKGKSNTFEEKEFERSTLDVWNLPTSRLFHPCPFHAKLSDRCVKLFSYINDTVLDPFMGSGTTGISCKKLGRYFIGIEKEKKYFEIAKKRLISIKDFIE